MFQEELWKKCVSFHGHTCGGLAIGFRAALYAMDLLGISFSEDEDVVCVTENDACGVDAIQVVLGCSAGKGNLLFRLRGKQVFSFFNRKNGKSVRISLKNTIPKGSTLEYMETKPAEELFCASEVAFPLPEPARSFQSVECDGCHELTADHMIRLCGGKKLCLDCFTPYSRFSL